MSEIILSGVAASEGMAVGVLVQRQLQRNESANSRKSGDSEHEQRVLRRALERAHAQISRLINELDQPAAEIMEFQLALLEDEDFLAPAFASVNEGMPAHEAWIGMVDAEIADYTAADDDYMVARSDDLTDLKERVLEAISGRNDSGPLPAYGKDVIMATHRITPSEFLKFDPASVCAIAVSGGSPSSHVAVLARARGIPMLVGCGDQLLEVQSGSAVLVDTALARIIVNPQKARQIDFRRKLDRYRNLEKQASRRINEPTFTKDGERVTIYANVDNPSLLARFDITPFDGVGLTRTEFLFENGKLPGEEAQLEAYRGIMEWAAGRPVTIRTLDAGGDKPIRGVTPDGENNPFLGLRGYRLSQSNQDMFQIQLRALARIATLGPLKVMIPMVTTPLEMEQFRALFARVVVTLKSEGVACAQPSLGMMIEVPSAAIEAGSFDADFYSIGSNDLIQYTLAAARDDPNVNYLIDERNPAVLKLIKMAVRAAARRNVEVSICGDMASVPELAALLLGVGIRALSVSIPGVAKVKQAVRQWARDAKEESRIDEPHHEW